MLPECPFGDDCKEMKRTVKSLEIAHATMKTEAKNMAASAERIEKSVLRMEESSGKITADLYAKYGEVKESIHSEVTNRMEADRAIEENIETKGNGKSSRYIAIIAVVIAFLGLFLK